MLTEVEVRNQRGDLLSLPLEDDSRGLVVESIEGLDPVTATLISSSFAQIDGAQYHTSRREPRNIKLRLGLDPDYIGTSVSDLRKQLYNFFMPKTSVDLTFRSNVAQPDGRVVEDLVVDITGRIESFETPLFSKEPAVDISLMCFDPDFHDPNPLVFEGNTTAGSEEVVIHYKGTVETGLLFSLFPNRDISEFTIYARTVGGPLRTLDFSAPLLLNDTLRISTVVGSKYVTRTRANVETPMLYAMAPQSSWLELLPGENYIRVYAAGLAIPYNITYSNKYGGL